MPFPETIKVDEIDRKHPLYAERLEDWRLYDLLAQGGTELAANASKFLKRKPKEPDEVYEVRLSRFTYENHLGTGIGWYLDSLFGRDPEVDLRTAEQQDLAEASQSRLKRIREDVDRRGTSFVDFYRRVFEDLVKFRFDWILIDRTTAAAESRADEQGREFDPYLVRYEPWAVINWSEDRFGGLEWVVVKKQRIEGQVGEKPKEFDQWWVYDRLEFAVFERQRKEDGKEEEIATRVETGPHAMAAFFRVPFRRPKVPAHLWLANRAALAVKEHVDVDNSLSWKIFLANVSQPVFYSEKADIDKLLADWSYLQLNPNDKFEFVEPGGSSFEHSQKRIERKREEIYRLMHLVHQGRSSAASAAAQSGFSKEMDLAPAQDIQEAFGDALRKHMKGTLEDLALVAGIEDLVVEVRGFNFKKQDADELIATVERARALNLQSDTLHLELDLQVAGRLLQDADTMTIEQAKEEIKAGKTRSAVLEEEERKLMQAERQAFGGAA